MASIPTTNDRIIVTQPPQPVDPTGCPTCLSGTPPRDPWFEVAIEPEKAVG